MKAVLLVNIAMKAVLLVVYEISNNLEAKFMRIIIYANIIALSRYPPIK